MAGDTPVVFPGSEDGTLERVYVNRRTGARYTAVPASLPCHRDYDLNARTAQTVACASRRPRIEIRDKRLVLRRSGRTVTLSRTRCSHTCDPVDRDDWITWRERSAPSGRVRIGSYRVRAKDRRQWTITGAAGVHTLRLRDRLLIVTLRRRTEASARLYFIERPATRG